MGTTSSMDSTELSISSLMSLSSLIISVRDGLSSSRNTESSSFASEELTFVTSSSNVTAVVCCLCHTS